MQLEPPVKVRVVATEGFGHGAMSPYTFGILRALSGKEISIRAGTPGRPSAAGEMPDQELPVILATTTRVSPPSALSNTEEKGKHEVRVGSRVRVIRGELLGASGIIDSTPAEPQATEAGLTAPGAYVKIEDRLIFIPWANLEKIL